MEKELHEHPAVIGDTLHRMVNPATRAVALPDLPFDLAALSRISLTACGGAYYAGLAGRHWIEAVARMPADIDVASEFRYRRPPLPRGRWRCWSRSRARRRIRWRRCNTCVSSRQQVLSVLNVPESTMARESDAVLETVAGPEIGVATHQGVHRAADRAGLPRARRRRAPAARSMRRAKRR